MSKEVFPGNEDGYDSQQSAVESIEQYLKLEPAVAAARAVLSAAKEADTKWEEINPDRSLRYRISSITSEFPFFHDRVLLIPKRNMPTDIAYREMRFMPTAKDQEDIVPDYIIITDYDQEDRPREEFILTEMAYGWYNDDVQLAIENDQLVGVHGLEHEPDFDARIFIDELSMFDIKHQSNQSTEAA